MAGSVREQDEGDRRGLAAVRGEIGCSDPADAGRSLRVLFLVSAHNSLSQRAWIALTELGHEVTVAIVDSAAAMEAAVGAHRPQLIVCPMLKTMIPESIWAKHRCLVVHPGPRGDRGPSSLDWAIELGARHGASRSSRPTASPTPARSGPTRAFRAREVGKSSLYRHEVRRAAIEALVEAMGRIADGAGAPAPFELGAGRRPARPAR